MFRTGDHENSSAIQQKLCHESLKVMSIETTQDFIHVL